MLISMLGSKFKFLLILLLALQITNVPSAANITTEASPNNLLLADNSTSNDSMENPEWIQEPQEGEIVEAIHALDFFHVDFSMTGDVLVIVLIIIGINLVKPTLHLPILRHIPESVVLMAYGIIIASITKMIPNIDAEHLTLSPKLFFMFLLPPIVIDTGLCMDKKEFFNAMGKISLFAMVGTVMNTLSVAAILYYCNPFYSTPIDFLPLILFSALISAVDPVSVLSTFSEIDVKKSLFIHIFGESLLNDAVTIVLYRTALNIIKNDDALHAPNSLPKQAFSAFVQFMMVTVMGTVFGIISGIVTVVIVRFFIRKTNHFIVPLFQFAAPYATYLIAESFHYSGIMASIATCMILSYYTKMNACAEMQFVGINVSKMFSSTAEMAIFIYLGLALVSWDHKFELNFVTVTIVGCTAVRFILVVFLSALYNTCVTDNEKIPFNDQVVITHAGIRGAVCFGLVQSIDDRVIAEKQIFVTATLAMIVFTSLFQGCTIKFVMKVLKIEGDNGVKPVESRFFAKLKSSAFFGRFLNPKQYEADDHTFSMLHIPHSVSTALRIAERSHPDLRETQSHPDFTQQSTVSVPRPTVSPFPQDVDDCLFPPAPHSAGRRTPVQRSSIYSRHFVKPLAISFQEDEPENDYYRTCPATIQKKRAPFNPHETFAQHTIGGAEREQLIKKRHNSISAGESNKKERTVKKVSIIDELEEKPKMEKKLSRTVMSGNKKFVVEEDSSSTQGSSSSSPKTDSEPNVERKSKFNLGENSEE